MTTIRASCPGCGEIDLTPEDIVLTVVRSEDAAVGPDSHYSFRCPTCAERVEKPADERIAHLLTTGGVEVEIVDDGDLDEELAALVELPPHPEGVASGPALTYDDLLDLHFALEEDGWFDRLVVSVATRA